MRLNLIVYKEAHARANMGFSERPSLKEEIGAYRCRIVSNSERNMWNVSAGSPSMLRREVDRTIAKMPEGTEVETICCGPPEDVGPRTFIKVRQGVRLLGEDGKPLHRRYDSSGTLMMATPLPLDNREIDEFNAPASD